MRNALTAVALTAVFTVAPCAGVLALASASDDAGRVERGERIGRLDNFRPTAGLDTSQVIDAR